MILSPGWASEHPYSFVKINISALLPDDPDSAYLGCSPSIYIFWEVGRWFWCVARVLNHCSKVLVTGDGSVQCPQPRTPHGWESPLDMLLSVISTQWSTAQSLTEGCALSLGELELWATLPQQPVTHQFGTTPWMRVPCRNVLPLQRRWYFNRK